MVTFCEEVRYDIMCGPGTVFAEKIGCSVLIRYFLVLNHVHSVMLSLDYAVYIFAE